MAECPDRHGIACPASSRPVGHAALPVTEDRIEHVPPALPAAPAYTQPAQLASPKQLVQQP